MPVDTDTPRLVRGAGRRQWLIRHNGKRTSTGEIERGPAERYLADYIKNLAQPVAPVAEPVAAILTRYLADRKASRKPGAERLEWAHKPLTKHLGDLAGAAFTKADALRYADLRRADSVADSTIRTELQALRAALRWSLGATTAPLVDMPGRPAPRERWLTRAEAAKILDACHGYHVRVFVMLALHTAARAGSILALTWDRVDLENRRVDYREPGKVATRKRRVAVPINDVLLPLLVEAKARAVSPFVVEFAGGQVGSVKHAIHDTAVRAGVAGVTPHVFRHTAATWMAQAGVPLWEVAGILGHSDAKMVAETYGHHSPEHFIAGTGALAGVQQ